ncbi:MAG: hypothetical protein K0R65_1529 [Crocinitomicaceae bacterium]|jgi:hypothetical protein|nr:hypothetical protein [Crocinitomicaceae bacterium]
MKKAEQIITLIESDIIISKLVLTLDSIHIDADKYNTDISIVVLAQMGYKEQNRTDDLYEEYFNLIRQVLYLDLEKDGEKRRLANKIYNYLKAQI